MRAVFGCCALFFGGALAGTDVLLFAEVLAAQLGLVVLALLEFAAKLPPLCSLKSGASKPTPAAATSCGSSSMSIGGS
uniref:Putative secreted protein n=1 Tax=Ixodes ricinus TaxID=34613 RepID=A0A147BUT6_IXORI